MIFVWIANFFCWLLRLFIPPPAKRKTLGFDPNELCPACGTGKTNIRCVTLTSKPGDPQAVRKVLMVVTCEQCGCYVYRTPLITDNPDLLHGPEVAGI